MIKRLGVLGVSVALALLVGPALANDSTAELRAGGLVLTRTNNIEMRSEDLFISAAQVRVTYRFFNRSSSPVTTQVAFPMPEITVEGPDENISIPLPNSANFLGFSTTVDGRPVTARLEQRVFVRGAEQTDRLRRLGIPLMPLSSRTSLALERLPRAQQEELIRLGLAVVNAYDQGRGMERHLQATWTLRTTYHWQQTFPPGREITVAHRYRPAVGATAGTGLNNADYLSREEGRDSVRRYCVDEPFLVATDARRKEVYLASYAEGVRVEGPVVTKPAEVATDLPVAGKGPVLYPEAFPHALPIVQPSAGWLAHVITSEAAELLDPEPLYLRRPDAVAPGKPKPVS